MEIHPTISQCFPLILFFSSGFGKVVFFLSSSSSSSSSCLLLVFARHAIRAIRQESPCVLAGFVFLSYQKGRGDQEQPDTHQNKRTSNKTNGWPTKKANSWAVCDGTNANGSQCALIVLLIKCVYLENETNVSLGLRLRVEQRRGSIFCKTSQQGRWPKHGASSVPFFLRFLFSFFFV